MRKILPFKGILYNQDKIKTLADVVTPPYDVISAEMQDEFYERSPYNFCRIDYTQEEGAARYETASQVFADFLSQGILIQEREPALYVHHHSFILPNGRKIVRKGFFAARRIEDFSEGNIKPHEKTLEGPKTDRLLMTRATHCHLSPVFTLYADPHHEVSACFNRLVQSTPFVDFMSHEGERHQLWRLKEAQAFATIDAFLSTRPLFIADGHHRYETALNYRNEVRAQNPDLPENSSVNQLLMYFSNMNDDGLVILPIHRALQGLPNFSLADFLSQVSAYFSVETLTKITDAAVLAKMAALSPTHHAFWILTKDSQTSYLLTLERRRFLDSDLARSLPPSLATLDVSVLHRLIFEKILGLSEESQARQENLLYYKSTQKAIEETRQGSSDLTFILNPTRMADMAAVAGEGHKMPQKSTYFYPKIVSGLILHSAKMTDTDS